MKPAIRHTRIPGTNTTNEDQQRFVRWQVIVRVGRETHHYPHTGKTTERIKADNIMRTNLEPRQQVREYTNPKGGIR